jgi:hypothetical protein
MAPTNAQLLAQAKAQLAKTKARLKEEQDKQAILNASTQSSTVNTTTMAGITAASRGETGYVAPVDTYTTAKVGSSGLTQAQLDAQANAIATAKQIGGTVIANPDGPGLKVVAPKTTPVIKKKVPVPGDPDYVPPENPADPDAKLLTKEEWDAIQLKTAEEARLLNERRDAFALIQQTMQGYGFTLQEYNELSKYIEEALINPKIGPNQMILALRALPTYKARFDGNEKRIKNGLNALSEANYIEQENSYAQYLKAGGVSNLGNRATYAKLIGGAVSPTEVGKRVNMAVDRVTTADPAIMKQIYKYNPNISQQDLVSYFLDPDNTLPELEKKVAMGEIGAVATQQGLDAGFGRIEDLQQYGVTRAQAVAGYGNIGQVLPAAEKLGDVYSESGITYDQATGESEFFKSNASAMDKRSRLASMERGTFAASAGNAPGAYSTGYLKKSSTAGQI